MRLSQARGVCGDLLFQDYDPSLCFAAQKELVADLVEISPRVSGGGIGEIFLDAGGLAHTGGESKFCRELLRLVSRRGYVDALVGIADCAFAAGLATRTARRRWLIVPSGGDIEFLAGLPLEFLPVSEEVKESLKTLGIKTIGQYRDLSVDKIRHRFGVEGERAYRLASGVDDLRPMLPVPEKSFQCVLDLGGPLESLTDTIFVMKSLLQRLVAQLVSEGLCAEELTVYFYSDDLLFEERPISLVKPSNQSKFLLEVLRLSLESKPLSREFTAIKLVVSKTVKESFDQLEIAAGKDYPKYGGDSDFSSSAFAYLLQRLETRLGEGVLVRPVAEDNYFPEMAGNWQPVNLKETRTMVMEEPSTAYALRLLNNEGVAAGLVLKRQDEPVPALVELKEAKPFSVTFSGVWYRVLHITSPEKLSGNWWEESLRKSYYMALLQSVSNKRSLVLLTYNHQQKSWFMEGSFD